MGDLNILAEKESVIEEKTKPREVEFYMGQQVIVKCGDGDDSPGSHERIEGGYTVVGKNENNDIVCQLTRVDKDNGKRKVFTKVMSEADLEKLNPEGKVNDVSKIESWDELIDYVNRIDRFYGSFDSATGTVKEYSREKMIDRIIDISNHKKIPTILSREGGMRDAIIRILQSEMSQEVGRSERRGTFVKIERHGVVEDGFMVVNDPENDGEYVVTKMNRDRGVETGFTVTKHLSFDEVERLNPKVAIKSIEEAETFEQLYYYLERRGFVEGTNRSFDYHSLRNRIDKIRDTFDFSLIPGTGGLREKVVELATKEKMEDKKTRN